MFYYSCYSVATTDLAEVMFRDMLLYYVDYWLLRGGPCLARLRDDLVACKWCERVFSVHVNPGGLCLPNKISKVQMDA